MSATAEQIQIAIKQMLKASERVSRSRSTDAIVDALAQTARNWLEPASPWRQRAIEQAPASTGFSSAMVSEAVDLIFGAITAEALGELLDQELGDRRVMDGQTNPHPSPLPSKGEGIRITPRPLGGEDGTAPTGPDEGTAGCAKRHAIGPRLIAHFLAGNVPAPGIVSICCGLLLKSANLVKVSRRDPVFPSLFVESLRAVDAELADCVAVLDWRREELALTQAALAEADAVIAYGDDETIAAIRRMCRLDARFLGYGHKLSFAVIGKEAMTPDSLPSLAAQAAFDASVYDQQGCLSPHAIYVEEGGASTPRDFAAALAEAMAAYQTRIPRGRLSMEEAAQIARLRGAYEFRSASDKRVAVWCSSGVVGRLDKPTPAPHLNPLPASGERRFPSPLVKGEGQGEGFAHPSNSWLVIYEEDPTFTPSCLNRVIFVKPVGRLDDVLELVQRYAPHLSTVGIAPVDKRSMALAGKLARLGVDRICPIGQMQRPPLTWQHDGRPNLADLVRWTDAG